LKNESFDTTGDCVVGKVPSDDKTGRVEYARLFEQTLVSGRECLNENESSIAKELFKMLQSVVPDQDSRALTELTC